MPVVTARRDQCPQCGAPVTGEPWGAGLCVSCLLELGLTAHATEPAEGEDDRHTMAVSAHPFAAGRVLGQRYRLRALLGRGGMGEVYRAFDLKLRVDVALKALRSQLLDDQRALDQLRHEVRAAREVISPNVCRVFDLVELDGHELLSMEYVDGVTLAQVLRERSPLPLCEAREIAAQLLAGLEAIHTAGLVHRDIKPENLMLTRAGRVVVMDFGIARGTTHTRTNTISGTPAYMAPEQTRGEPAGARADVFSAGVVLAELVAPAGVRTEEARAAFWRGIHDDAPEPGETAWRPVLCKAIARRAEARYAAAASLARALEEVTLRTRADETECPYPGLAAFTEREADFFVGRELEIEELWKRLRRPHLLGLIGPSGAGKSSFLRAGLARSAPDGWRLVFATPTDRPFAALAQALAPELAGDVEAVARLIDFEQPGVALEIVSRWRRRHQHAVLIVDQFEELFTQSPQAVQEAFAQLLARLALDADVHVLLSLRDDFLFHCHRFESLAPVFADIMPIGPPTGTALRRALVQPGLKCGYRFEDEAMVEELLAQVAGERGALPLVAFAMARLWELRDRERGLLTRTAYERIGGVGGALAQHAEATLAEIGEEPAPIVRELFRNLVMAAGTRATVDRDDLLSVFAAPAGSAPEVREQAASVLDTLVNARLLTSYDVAGDDLGQRGQRRIEIVHESLLTAWPRLVRWQTQDQDGAQLRDQLRQAARLWEDRGQPEDLLWTGTSFREYELWSERYAGALSAGEDRFTRAMKSRALRRRRQRQLVLAAVLVAAAAIATIMGVLWRQSEAARATALTAARHAEAQQLFTLAQLEQERHPGAAYAYVLASLERYDTQHARRFALGLVSQGPLPFVLERDGAYNTLAFSPNGIWLAGLSGAVRVWKDDGSAPRDFPGSPDAELFAWMEYTGDSRTLAVTQSNAISLHSLDEGQTRRIPGQFRWGLVRDRSLITGSFVSPLPDGRPRRLFRRWPLPAGAPEQVLGTSIALSPEMGTFNIDDDGRRIYSTFDNRLYAQPLHALSETPRLVVDTPVVAFALVPGADRLFAWPANGPGAAWSRTTGEPLAGPRLPDKTGAFFQTAVSQDGRWLATVQGGEVVYLSTLAGPADAEPLLIKSGGSALAASFDPTGTLLAVHDNQRVTTLWPLSPGLPVVLRGPGPSLRGLTADPHGRWIASADATALWVWPLQSDRQRRLILPMPAQPIILAASPRGDLIVAGTVKGVWLMPLDGRPPKLLPGFASSIGGLAFDDEGRYLAASGGITGELSAPGESVVRVWDLDTGEVRVFDDGIRRPIVSLDFLGNGRLVAASTSGVVVWDVHGRSQPLLDGSTPRVAVAPDGRHLLGIRGHFGPARANGVPFVYDLQDGRSWDLERHGTEVTAIAWHPSGGQIVTGSRDGTVRIGPVNGDEPHLLLGHTAALWTVTADPQGRWVASAAEDGTVRIWPLPEGPPLHALPHAELLDQLRRLSNYRVIADVSVPAGYRLDFEPLRGWKDLLPAW
jgi:WD40 repeat protein/tRNA A-37 threonylcarbamoyl transferase component Bud32